MSVDVSVERTIKAPIEHVADYSADPSNATAWYRRIRTTRWVTEPVVQIGSKVEFEARFMGRRLVYTYEIVRYTPRVELSMSTATGPFPMTTDYAWTAVGAGWTLMTMRNHGQPSGFAKLVAPLIARMMRRAMSGDLAQLAQLMEA